MTDTDVDRPPPRPTAGRPTVGNRVVLALLRSPLRRVVGRRVCALRYTGRLSGATVTLPVQYVRRPGGLVVLAGRGGGKRWWRNFAPSEPVAVWLDGRWHDGVGAVLVGEERVAALADYVRVVSQVDAATDDPVVGIRLPG
ncbi:hypothetical protein [Modestobacter sp. NPDC049651]|uniref:hypothetical protein n=1 Tax=unclassified Modestobacter TaxID=2643866 RepID=UPI0033EB4730